MWASVISDGPGKIRIYIIDSAKQAVKRPFAKTIRVKVVEMPPPGRHKAKF